MKTRLQAVLQKILVILAMIGSNISFAQIPNWDFESWNSITNDVPSPWLTFGKSTKVSPGASGQYALKMQGYGDSGPGAAIYGNPGGDKGQFLGGTPFTARPDSVVAYFKYDITVGDSAWVLFFFKKNGVNISNDLYMFTGTNTSNFQRKAFKVHFVNGLIPDTLFIGFTSTMPESSTPNTVSWVIVDNISFTGTTQNVPNPDFESWTSTTINYPAGWDAESRAGYSSVERSTDKYGGNYAMKVQTIFTPTGDTLSGYTQTTRQGNNWNWGPAFPVNSRPTSLKGYYKFIPQNGDTFTIHVNMFKNGQGVGGGRFESAGTVNTYTPLSIAIDYYNLPSGNPDSASIGISTFAMNQNNIGPLGQSVAYIDNLSFDQFIAANYPRITSLTPALANRGQTLNVNINGTNTHFMQVTGLSAISFTNGTNTLMMNSFNKLNDSTLTVSLTLKQSDALGYYTLRVTNPTDSLLISDSAFQVKASTVLPKITSVNPASGNRKQTLTVSVSGSATHFTQGPDTVSFYFGGSPTAKIKVNSTTVVNDSSLTCSITIDSTASNGAYDVYVKNMVDGNISLASAFSIVSTGINEMQHAVSTVLIYPNPVKDQFTLKYNIDNPQRINISLMDINSRLIRVITDEKKATGNYEMITNVRDLDAGIYFIRIADETYVHYSKLIIEK